MCMKGLVGEQSDLNSIPCETAGCGGTHRESQLSFGEMESGDRITWKLVGPLAWSGHSNGRKRKRDAAA